MFNKTFVSMAVAGACALGASIPAQAGVLGQSVLEILNFRFLNPNGTVISAAQLVPLAFNDSTNATANLNNVIATHAKNQNTFGTLDDLQQCVDSPAGACAAFGQNNFSHRLAPSTVNVARADTLLHGAPIINPVVSPPADAHVVNEGQLTTEFGFGAIQANLGLTASFQFALAASQTVTIAMDSLSHLIAAVDLGDNGTARASEQWTIEIRDHVGNVVFSWSPDGVLGSGITGGTESSDTCNLNLAVNAQQPNQTSQYDCAGTHSATTLLLTGGERYTLGLRHAGDVDVTRNQQIPEPNSLLLFGVALAGLGFVTRRKNG